MSAVVSVGPGDGYIQRVRRWPARGGPDEREVHGAASGCGKWERPHDWTSEDGDSDEARRVWEDKVTRAAPWPSSWQGGNGSQHTCLPLICYRVVGAVLCCPLRHCHGGIGPRVPDGDITSPLTVRSECGSSRRARAKSQALVLRLGAEGRGGAIFVGARRNQEGLWTGQGRA